MSKQGEWVKMGDLIDDDMLSAFAVVTEPEKVPDEIFGRYGDLVDRFSFYTPYTSDEAQWSAALDRFRQLAAR
jgi:hypothetical protein